MCSSNSEAKVAGHSHYFTGKPCKHGHLVPRKVNVCVCVECDRLYKNEYYARTKKHPKRLLTAKEKAVNRRAYLETNRDRRAKFQKKYREANKEKLRQQKKEWYQKNKEKIVQKQKEYYEKIKRKSDSNAEIIT